MYITRSYPTVVSSDCYPSTVGHRCGSLVGPGWQVVYELANLPGEAGAGVWKHSKWFGWWWGLDYPCCHLIRQVSAVQHCQKFRSMFNAKISCTGMIIETETAWHMHSSVDFVVPPRYWLIATNRMNHLIDLPTRCHRAPRCTVLSMISWWELPTHFIIPCLTCNSWRCRPHFYL